MLVLILVFGTMGCGSGSDVRSSAEKKETAAAGESASGSASDDSPETGAADTGYYEADADTEAVTPTREDIAAFQEKQRNLSAQYETGGYISTIRLEDALDAGWELAKSFVDSGMEFTGYLDEADGRYYLIPGEKCTARAESRNHPFTEIEIPEDYNNYCEIEIGEGGEVCIEGTVLYDYDHMTFIGELVLNGSKTPEPTGD